MAEHHPLDPGVAEILLCNGSGIVSGRLVNHAGRHKLRLPANWPWARTFTRALRHLRNLPLLI